jgi:hypothetical protein
MATRHSSRIGGAFGLAVVVIVAMFQLGCGAKFELPTETPGGSAIPGDGTYEMEATWTGMTGVRDLLYTPSGQLYVLLNDGMGTVDLDGYSRFKPTPEPLGYPFRTLFNPVQMCEGQSYLFVLDQGDTCAARANPDNGRCVADSSWHNDVHDLNKYWRVREFTLVGAGMGGADTISTFTDTTLAMVEGVAADDVGAVYVSGLAIVNVPDFLDPRIKTRSFLWQIRRYLRGPRYPGVTPADPNMPGANWHRDTTWVVEQGEGTGFVNGPRGIYWRRALNGAGLFSTEVNTNRAQKLYDDLVNTAFFQITEDDVGTRLARPLDVSADELGDVYVADTENRRALRFGPGGQFIQRVDVEPDAQGQALDLPVTIAADSLYAFIGDFGRGKVIRYRRRL